MEEGERDLVVDTSASFMETISLMLSLQEKMGQLMDRGKCGGSYGGTEHWCIREAILLNSRTLIISSSLTSLCSILLSGQSILFIAVMLLLEI
jgi:hypothetical protein